MFCFEMKANKERLYQDVLALTSIEPARCYPNQESLEAAAKYIATAMEAAGVEPEHQQWTAGGLEHRNIIASYNREGSRRLIVGAHYDVCGEQPGADDNASAVAGLLELVRLTSQQQPRLDYRIDFVAYSL
jgi:acetylornithine deacetylase/succinyl-diaminopimelate desuccinylase-like protein